MYFLSTAEGTAHGPTAARPRSTVGHREMEKLGKLRRISLTQAAFRAGAPQGFFRYRRSGGGDFRALKAVLCSPNPQHVTSTARPGVAKTCAARFGAEEARKTEGTPLCAGRAILKWTPPACAATSAPSRTL